MKHRPRLGIASKQVLHHILNIMRYAIDLDKYFKVCDIVPFRPGSTMPAGHFSEFSLALIILSYCYTLVVPPDLLQLVVCVPFPGGLHRECMGDPGGSPALIPRSSISALEH